jgi:hypothetical protein
MRTKALPRLNALGTIVIGSESQAPLAPARACTSLQTTKPLTFDPPAAENGLKGAVTKRAARGDKWGRIQPDFALRSTRICVTT